MNYKHFTQDERDRISILLKKGHSHKEIASVLEKDRSSVSREIKRNSVKGIYNPIKAHQKARVKRSMSKYAGMKVQLNPEVKNYVRVGMKRYWTPEQIAGRWKKYYAEKHNIIISAPSIYKWLYSPYGQGLCGFLLSKRYRKRKRKGKKQKKETIKNRVFIDKRPKIINERKRVGDFEGDIMGSKKSDKQAMAGLVDRKSRFLLVVKKPRLKYAVDGFKELLNPYRNILHSLTLDNGVENARYQELRVKTYFCNPYSSWEKGSIENSFQRFRRFVPKKSSLKNFNNSDLKRFSKIMNHTPRKCLNWQTPYEVLTEYQSKFDSS
ncbi:MAG: IS30 family transposase [Candidatus Jacksonbacteria bacterium]